VNNPFTNAIRGLGENASGLLTGTNPLSQPQITSVFGFTVPGTPLISTRDFFLSQMESWFTTIPLRTQWMLLIQGYPQLLQTEVVQSLEDRAGNYNNFDINQAVSILKSYPLNKVIGCVFAQGIDIPSMQKLSTSKTKVFNDKQRGFIPGQISEGKNSFDNLTIQFRETNTSFVDFVVRPWSMLSSHFGFVARQQGDLRDVSTTISILQFTRSYQKLSQIPRKIWTFYNCFPVSVGNQNLTYDQEAMDINTTEWTYSNYTVQNNLYLPLPDIINKIASGNINRISPFQR
jgi:hypothetical protein